MSKKKSSKYSDNFKVELKNNQKSAENFLNENSISIFSGSAGVGKDFIQLHRAVTGLISGEFSELIFMRPAIEVGKGIGFLPGDLKEKLDPYQQSFIDNLNTMVNKPIFERVKKKIRFEHTGFCRGKSYFGAVVILSEAQNCTLHELITIVTRVGHNSKLLINGDKYQSDIIKNGFSDFINIIEDIEGIGHMFLGDEYQMRNPIIINLNKKYVNFLKKKNV